ncbi:MAG: DUF2760 domain-containing protein [Myxococcales bacterium]
MAEPEQTYPTAWQRFVLAFVAFFAVLFNREFARGVFLLRQRGQPELPTRPERDVTPKKPEQPAANVHAEALHLLAILQREGRLVDFLQEDVSAYGDADIGAAARAVHGGCRKALQNYLSLEPVYREPEGASITLEPGFDASRVRLTGNVVGNPPFRGSLRHHGWRAREVKLPTLPEGQDATIIAPAEVELP